jgi:hypothetical protein
MSDAADALADAVDRLDKRDLETIADVVLAQRAYRAARGRG